MSVTIYGLNNNYTKDGPKNKNNIPKMLKMIRKEM